VRSVDRRESPVRTVTSRKATDGQVRVQGDLVVGYRAWGDNDTLKSRPPRPQGRRRVPHRQSEAPLRGGTDAVRDCFDEASSRNRLRKQAPKTYRNGGTGLQFGAMPHFTYIAGRWTPHRARRGRGGIRRGGRERLRKRALIVEEISQTVGRRPPRRLRLRPRPPGWSPTRNRSSWPRTGPREVQTRSRHESTAAQDVAVRAPFGHVPPVRGWLLAWYALVYLLGSYQRNYDCPTNSPSSTTCSLPR